MASVKFERVNKIYPNGTRALTDVNFEINEGEFCVFVGPSGCGKSTMLRMIAGLEEVTTGKIYIDGVVSNEVLPKDRDIAMVFQNYALYPHLTVYQNMAFGLEMQQLVDENNPVDEKGRVNKIKFSKEEVRKRVEDAAKTLGIEDLLSRKPGQLSGGQKQRVALGRALVRKAKLFLLDEPLSNVDAQIRSQMRSEIKSLQKQLGITFIYVTHDQVEAMTMADKIIVMNKGQVMQIGSPLELYRNPQNLFVASFLGTPAMNLFGAKFIRDKGLFVEPNGAEKFKIPDYKDFELADPDAENCELICGFRPKDSYLSDKGGELVGRVFNEEFLGSSTVSYLKIEGQDRTFSSETNGKITTPADKDGKTYVVLNRENLHLFRKDNGKSILGLPDLVYLTNAKIMDNTLVFEGNELETTLLDRAYDSNLINLENLTIGIDPKMIKTKEEPSCLKVDGTVVHFSSYTGKKFVFIRTKSNSNISFYDYEDKEYKIGQSVSIYLPEQFINIYEKPFGNRLTAKWELFENVLSTKADKLKINKKNLEKSEEYVLDKFTTDVRFKHRFGYQKFVVMDDDVLENKTVVYAKTKNRQYISLVLDGLFDRHNSPVIYINLSASNLKMVK